MIEIFSEKLTILNRNTVNCMMDEMQREINVIENTIDEQTAKL